MELWLPRIFKEDPEKYADVCKCSTCIAHIKVEALNRLTPFYVTGKVGEVFGEYQIKAIQYKTDLMVAISGAIEQVHAGAHKRHEPEIEPSLQSLATLRRRDSAQTRKTRGSL